MRTIVLLIPFAFIILNEADCYSFGVDLVEKLNTQIDSLNRLIVQVEKIYTDDIYHHPMPNIIKSTIGTADHTLDRASRLVKMLRSRRMRSNNRELGNSEEENGQGTRRSNNRDLMWKENFYKALSRALKEEFKNEPVVQENIQDGFTPPTFLKKRRY